MGHQEVTPTLVTNLTESIRRARDIAPTRVEYIPPGVEKIDQADGLSFYSPDYGKEIFKLALPKHRSKKFPDITWPQWSADGKRLVYQTSDSKCQVMRSCGMMSRPIVTPSEESINYFIWSPVEPDTSYSGGGETSDKLALYTTIYTDETEQASKILTLPSDNYAASWGCKKSITPDGKLIMMRSSADQWYYGGVWVMPVRLLPTPDLMNPGPWKVNRPVVDYTWGHWRWEKKDADNCEGFACRDAALEDGAPQGTADARNGGLVHDCFTAGAEGGDYGCVYLVLPEGGYDPAFNDWDGSEGGGSTGSYGTLGTWFASTFTGSEDDGGPRVIPQPDYENPPFNFGTEYRPIDSNSNWDGCSTTNRKPQCCDPNVDCSAYFSHAAFDMWGRCVAYSDGEHGGVSVYDYQNQVMIDETVEGSQQTQHLDWHAWSDFCTSTVDLREGDENHDTVAAVDGVSGTPQTIRLATTQSYAVNDANYHRNVRPTQSPDGTKITFHSFEMISDDDYFELYYAVAYYPHPLEISSVSNGVVRFSWNTEGTVSRGYTQRGWPSETNDDPPPPRETQYFRLWKSDNGVDGWEPVDTVNADIFSRYDFSDGVWTGDNYWEITDPNPSGHYTVTSVEWCGLESRVVGNVFSAAGVETAAYPTDGGADTGITSTYNPDIVRHYNVYAKDGSLPAIDEANLVATVTAQTDPKYIDWLGKDDGTTQHVVIAVDTQGNESGALAITVVYKDPEAPEDGQYKITWPQGTTPPQPGDPEECPIGGNSSFANIGDGNSSIVLR